MGLFDGIVGSVLGGVLGIAGEERAADQQFENQSALQKQAYEYQKESMQNRHQWEVSDLKSAGLNPILSATHSAGGTINVGAGQAAKPDYSHAIAQIMNAFSNSAMVQNNMAVNQKNAESERINAEANYLRAENDQARTPSAVALADSQARMNLKSMTMLDKNYELQKIYNEAQVSKINQDILNSIAEVKARVEYYQASGQAALQSSSAALMQGSAALQNAENQRVIAEVAEKNGISQRALNDALEGKASQELKESAERVESIIAQRQKFKYEHPRAFGDEDLDFAQGVYQFGDYIQSLSPLRINFGD